MAYVDKLIEAARGFPGHTIRLAPGEQVSLVRGDERRPMSSQPLAANQIHALFQEILSDEQKQQFSSQGALQFAYASPAGEAEVEGRLVGDAPHLRIVPRESGTVTPPADDVGAREPSSSRASSNGSAATATPAIESLLREMVQADASDLHLTSGRPPLFRKDGRLTMLSQRETLTSQQVGELLYAILPEDKKRDFEQDMDADLSYEIPGLGRFRLNLFQDRTGIGGVFRFIPSKIPTANELGLPQSVLDMCLLPKGMVVVTGPTGSGKSTTLAAMIDHINRNQTGHIISIEDPIEFVHEPNKCLINQREVGAHTHSFKGALRAALREDPDIILVGEMRDLETISIAIETAETGHLVLGTLHTNTAASAVDRIIDQFPSERQNQIRSMLASSLKGVVAQTLLRKKNGGRAAALEVLLITPAIANLIREGKIYQIPSAMQTGRGAGMMTLNDSLLKLVKSGAVDVEEVLSKAASRSELESVLARAGVS
jgi:twitching motility protein PilT